MLNWDNLRIDNNTPDNIFKMFAVVLNRRKDKKKKEPKGSAKDGSYCPKKKAGQSWSYIKGTKEDEDDREDVA